MPHSCSKFIGFGVPLVDQLPRVDAERRPVHHHNDVNPNSGKETVIRRRTIEKVPRDYGPALPRDEH